MQSDLTANQVVYIHDGSETGTDSFGFTLSDGDAVLPVIDFALTITPVNDAPELVVNTGLAVSAGQTGAVIGQSLLEAADTDNTASELSYTLTSAPVNGTLFLGALALGSGDSFTQANVDSRQFSYSHDGSPTGADSFGFDISDGTEEITGLTFEITVAVDDAPPILTQNSPVAVVEGLGSFVTPAFLETTDPDTPAGQIAYTLQSLPANGILLLDNIQLVTGGMFTQTDIDTNLVVYRHDGGETSSDSVEFSVTDGTTALPAATLSFNIIPVDDAPSLTANTGLVVIEGEGAAIGAAQLAATDPDTLADALTFTLQTAPSFGFLALDGSALAAGGSFTQSDIDSGRLTYSHDGSETVNDTLSFELTDGTTTLAAGFAITVLPANDDPVLDFAGGSDLAGMVAELDETDPDEGRITLTVDGSITVRDFDLADTHTATVLPAASGYVGTFSIAQPTTTPGTAEGVIQWSFSADDSALDFLSEGQEVEQFYDVTVNDGNGGTDTEQVVVMLTGSNDNISVSGGVGIVRVLEAPDDSAEEASDAETILNGTLSFRDPDILDVHSVSSPALTPVFGSTYVSSVTTDTTGTGSGGVVSYEFRIRDSSLDFLAEGEEVFVSYGNSVGDGVGIDTNVPSQFLLTGANDAPKIDETGSQTSALITEFSDTDASENSAVHSVSGDLLFNDADLTDTHTTRFTPQSVGYIGSFTLVGGPSSTDSTTAGAQSWLFSVNDAELEMLAEGEELTQNFDVFIDDPFGGIGIQTVAIQLQGTNDAPVLLDEIFVTEVGEDGNAGIGVPVYFQLNGRASDPDSNEDAGTLTYEFVDLPSVGTVVETPASLMFTPGADFQYLGEGETEDVAFGVEAIDAAGARSNRATLTFRVEGANDAPEVAANAGLSVAQGSADNIIGQGLLAASDADNTAAELNYTIDSAPVNGTLFRDGSALADGDGFTQSDIDAGLIRYDHDGSGNVPDSFGFSVSDGLAAVSGQSFAISVTPDSQTSLVYDEVGVSVFRGTDGDVIEVPHDPDFEIPQGTIAFSFEPADVSGSQGLFTKDAAGFAGGGNHVAVYLVGSTLTARLQEGSNQVILTSPGIQPDREYEIAVTFGPDGSGLWVNGSLTAGSPLYMDWTQNVEVSQWGGRGWASASGAPGFDAPFNGTISDRQIYNRVLSEAEIAVLAANSSSSNNAPVVSDDDLTVREDSSGDIDPVGNDTDPENAALSVAGITRAPNDGAAVVNADGSVTYTPDPDFNGSDSFDVGITDGVNVSVSTVNVTVSPVNDTPVAADDRALTSASKPLVIDLLGNDTDVDGDTLSILFAEDPANGTVVNNQNGTVTYSPDNGFFGEESFRYTVSDGTETAEATVTVSVMNLPVPVVDEPQELFFDGTRGSVVETPHSAVYALSDATLSFTFNASNTNGQQGLFAKDATGFSGGGNHLAVYLDGTELVVRIQGESDQEIISIPGISSGTDYSFAIAFGPQGATLFLDAEAVAGTSVAMDWSNSAEYTQWGGRGWASQSGEPGFDAPLEGVISQVKLFDLVLSPDQVAELRRTETNNSSPSPLPDSIVIDEDSSGTVFPGANDIDIDGDIVTAVAIASAAAHGAAVLNPDGSVTYTPDPDFFGSDTFEVIVTDGNGSFEQSTVDVTVLPVNDDPVAVDDFSATQQAAPVTIDVLSNDADADGDTLQVSLDGANGPSQGSAAVNPDGTITYTPDPDFLGVDDFEYILSDGSGTTSTATVAVEVTVDPPAPIPFFSRAGITEFDGTRRSVENIAHDRQFEIGEGTVTFSFIADATSGRQGIFVKDASGFAGGGNHLAIYISGGDLIARFQDGTDSDSFVFRNLEAGEEYEVAAVFGTGVELWINGSKIGENAGFATDWNQNQEYLQIGGLGWGSETGGGAFSNPFDGRIADMEIYSDRLDDAQILSLAEQSSFDL